MLQIDNSKHVFCSERHVLRNRKKYKKHRIITTLQVKRGSSRKGIVNSHKNLILCTSMLVFLPLFGLSITLNLPSWKAVG